MPPIQIALVEDNAPFARMFQKHFSRPDSAIQCTGLYRSAEAALKSLPLAPPQVALMDINLPKMSGIECIARLKETCPKTVFIVLTTFDEEELIFNALKAGACGYLLKRSSPAEITAAIREAVAGGAPMSPQIARQVVSFFHSRPAGDQADGLSARQEQIITLLARGLLYKEIASQLNLSYETIRSYVKIIYDKLHAHSRTDAILKWQERSGPAGQVFPRQT